MADVFADVFEEDVLEGSHVLLEDAGQPRLPRGEVELCLAEVLVLVFLHDVEDVAFYLSSASIN